MDPTRASDLENMVAEAQARPGKKAETRRRVWGEVEERMDNGIVIHPFFQGRARRASETEEEAEASGAGPCCHSGHGMERCAEGSAGLWCDGGCGRRIGRGAEWWCCVACDFDVCDRCGGAARGQVEGDGDGERREVREETIENRGDEDGDEEM